jgi:hypothetical protein
VAQKPDGKAAKTERVTFTRPAAERIAKAVRKVEQGDRGASPLRFDRIGGGDQHAVLKVATFTGHWATNATHEISFNHSSGTNSNATAMAYNGLMPLFSGDGEGAGFVNCIVGKPFIGGQTAKWHLISVNLTQMPGYDPNVVQLFGHSTSTNSYVQWYSITTCSTATGA